MREFPESIVLLAIGYGRLIKAATTGGDVTLAKILLAEDLDDCGAHRLAYRRLSRIIAAHPNLPRVHFTRAMALPEQMLEVSLGSMGSARWR